ncbi:MAG TPA: elongation factor G [Chitinophagaceae bacterium]|nr:elongation factor G [Chitinophagaceae bacterium]
MKAYDQKHIKNIALIGAAKSGKTTLAETMLYEAGLINRLGSTEEKNTVSDYHEIEKERGNSVYATLLHTEWRDFKINIIDTPGLDDFIGEVISAIRVCDTAVVVLNAHYGVEAGTEVIWDYVDHYRKPTILAINQLDSDQADFTRTVEDARKLFGSAVTLMQYPLNPGLGFNAIIDLLKMVMYRFSADGGKPEKLPIPDGEKETAARLHNELVEKAAENDEDLMELYFEKGTLDENAMRKGLKIGMMNHEVFPVFCLSTRHNMGSGRLMGFIDNVAPSPTEMPPEHTTDGGKISCSTQGPTRLFVFKTLLETHLGRLSFFKVLSGDVIPGAELINENENTTERMGQLFITDGQNRNPVNRLRAGDIGCTLKLKSTCTGQTLNGKGAQGIVAPLTYPTHKVRAAIVATNKSDEEKLSEVLQDIQLEDPTLEIEYNRELKQMILHGQGDLHMLITKWRLENIFKLAVTFTSAKIPYRETIRQAALSYYRHKKQSGGAGQFGEVYMKIEPYYADMPPLKEFPVRHSQDIDLPWGGKLIFNNCIVGGAIDARFLPSIMKGVMEKLQEGPLTGSYVRDVRVSIYDGKMHPVDSNDIAFKIAGMMAFRQAFHEASPLLLEPIYDMEVSVPGEVMGDAMSELQAHRSIIMGLEATGDRHLIKTKTPQAELDNLLAALRNISQGKARVNMEFADYAPVSGDIQKKLADAYQKEQGEVS